jgi:asparagine synthase (glutamine-hydrolysing)
MTDSSFLCSVHFARPWHGAAGPHVPAVRIESPAHLPKPQVHDDAAVQWILSGVLQSKRDGTRVSVAALSRVASGRRTAVFEEFWGCYHCASLDKSQRAFHVYVDPSNRCPVYYTWSRHARTLRFGAHLSSLVTGDCAWDLTYFTDFVAHGAVQDGRTPLQGIRAAPCGCVLRCDESGPALLPLWNPCATTPDSRTSLLDALELAMTELDADCPVLLELSGGLDSSLLAALIARSRRPGRPMRCVHWRSGVGAIDEAPYARDAAAALGLPLDETEPAVLPFAPPEMLPLWSRPDSAMVFWERERSRHRLLGAYLDHHVVNGHGSDAIFMTAPPSTAPADALLAGRLPLFVRKVRELACHYPRPPLHIALGAARAFGRHLLGRRRPGYTVAPHAHPLLTGATRLPPGKLEQFASTLRALDEIAVDCRDASTRRAYPFLSQPVVEHALSTPSYELFSDQFNRLPLRRAAASFPDARNVRRMDKAETTGVTLLGLRHHHDSVKRLLMDGRLVREGVVCAEKVRQALNRARAGVATDLPFLCRLAGAELFIQSWETRDRYRFDV